MLVFHIQLEFANVGFSYPIKAGERDENMY